MPKHSHSAQKILANECCDQKCVNDITRTDVMRARRVYVKFYNRLNDAGKRASRYLFISMIAKVSNEYIEFSNMDIKLQICPDLLVKIFGFSYTVLMNGLTSPQVITYRSRPWYSKTIESLAEAIHSLSSKVQFNSLNRLMLPPNSNRSGIMKIPVSVVRERMDLKLRERKIDSLTRCNSCATIPAIIKRSKTDAERKEGEEVLRKHHRLVSQQRVIVDVLSRQSRDPEFDVTCCLMDGMSNKCCKLPFFVSRPKSVGDGERIGINVTSVQLCENYGYFDFPECGPHSSECGRPLRDSLEDFANPGH
ncbi:unnamed protein product [Caenorhabditis brenneri]